MKRSFDLLVSLAALVLLAPLLLTVALLVRIKLGSPVLFRQARPGVRGEPFTLLKFRTMLNDSRGDGQPLSDEERLTRFGRSLRALSLDELPELWNVLRGEMSLVGPRPLLLEYLPLYSPSQERRHEVRPGLTGWAQVNGRNAIGWAEKLSLDTWYVDHQSFALDLKIMFLTLITVLTRQGINAKGDATMPKFRGSGQ